MSACYEIASDAVTETVSKAIHDYHRELEAAGITVQVLFAFEYDNDGEPVPPMKVRGQVALAKTSITNLADRVRGIPDAKLIIDREFGYNRLVPARRLALIDHELTHLHLMLDADGAVQHDDHGRPKLRMRHHQFEIAGFYEVMERHGEAAPEWNNIRLFQEESGQYCLIPSPTSKEVERPTNGRDVQERPCEYDDPALHTVALSSLPPQMLDVRPIARMALRLSEEVKRRTQ